MDQQAVSQPEPTPPPPCNSASACGGDQKQAAPCQAAPQREQLVQLSLPSNHSWLRSEVQGFDPKAAIQAAWLPPKSWYTAPEFFKLERDSVFKENWLIAAREDQLRQPGQYVTGNIMGEPYVIVRGEDQQLRAFYNVCRHHAAEVATGDQGCLKKFECPYHGWTYALDGKLLSAPALGAVEGFDRKFMSLQPLKVEEWGGLVFVNRSENPRPLQADMAGLKTELDAMSFTGLTFVARREYEIKCNWKVFVDNYLDGGYHVPYLHKGLAGQLSLDTYTTDIYERYSIQASKGVSSPSPAQPAAADGAAPAAAAQPVEGGDFAERLGDRALYAWVYPNLMINRYGPMMDTNWVIPLDHERVRVVMDYYFEKTGTPEADDFIKKSLASSDVVQQEDIKISLSVQRGLGSESYEKGRYSVKKEMGELHFHKLLAEDYQNRIDKPGR